MNANDQTKEQNRKTVGVYDRPPSADRLRNLRMWIIAVAVIVSAVSVYFFLNP